MQTIAIASLKGGAGRTTLTCALATAAAAADLNALILDIDPQQSAAKWGRRRAELKSLELPALLSVTESNLLSELRRAEAAGCEVAFIDTPPGRNAEGLAAIEAADLILCPFWNDQDSFDGLQKIARLTRQHGKEAWGILNQATPNSRVHEDIAREVLNTIGLAMAPCVLHRYDVHRTASTNGLAAQELERDSVAAKEVARLWDWVRSTLDAAILRRRQQIAT